MTAQTPRDRGHVGGWTHAQEFVPAAVPTEVGTCKWCGNRVYSDEPRLSLGLGAVVVWHFSCAEACRDVLTDSLGPAVK